MAFEAFLKQDDVLTRPRKWRRFTYALSLSLHGILLLIATARSFWHVDELQPRTVAVHFMMAYSPPPPPPPPAAAPLVTAAALTPHKPAPPKPKPDELVQPKPEAAPEPEPTAAVASEATEAALDEAPAGDPNGVAGGDVTGVAGGDPVAAAPAPPPPPAPPPVEINLTPTTGTQLRTTDINDPRFRPMLPPALNRNGMVVAGLFRICVAPDGHVKGVSIMKSADPLVDQAWSDVIRTWEYRPYSIGGQAVSFCHAARIEIRAHS
jgi:hypothetical protein